MKDALKVAVVVILLFAIFIYSFITIRESVSSRSEFEDRVDEILIKDNRRSDSVFILYQALTKRFDSLESQKQEVLTIKYVHLYEKINIDSSFVYQQSLTKELLARYRHNDSAGCK